MINYILDTFYEFWQYFKQGNVYIAGIKHDNYYIILRMIPENVPVPKGYEVLSQAMPKALAEKRLQNFPLWRIVVPQKSLKTGT